MAPGSAKIFSLFCYLSIGKTPGGLNTFYELVHETKF